MYPAVAALSSLYGGANGVQNVGRVIFPNNGLAAAPQVAPYAQTAPVAVPRTIAPATGSYAAPPLPGPGLPGIPQMTPAQRMLYNRYMNLPGSQPAAVPRQPLYNPQAGIPTYAAVQSPHPATAATGGAPVEPTGQPVMSPVPPVSIPAGGFPPASLQPDMSGRGGMNAGALPYGGGINGLARYYMR